jgi:hypothetical protein
MVHLRIVTTKVLATAPDEALINAIEDGQSGHMPKTSRDVIKELEANEIKADSDYEELLITFLMAEALILAVDCPECDGSGGRYSCHGQPVQCKWCHDKGLVADIVKKNM